EDLPRLARGELRPRAQDPELASHAAPIQSSDTWLDFGKNAVELSNQIRGLAPRPGAAAELSREGEAVRRVRFLSAQVTDAELAPGVVSIRGERLLVGTGAGSLSVTEAQIEGKKAQAA